MKKQTKTIIIGAGLAGLTAAHYLKEAGREVVVVERDNRPGGRIQSVTKRNGDIIDVGAQFIHTNYKTTMELVRKFGLESDLIEMKTPNVLMRGEKSYAIKWKQLRIGAIPFWAQVTDSIRLLLMLAFKRKGLQLEDWLKLMDLDKIELSAFARLKLNEESYDYLARPLMLAYSMSEPEGISVAYFLRCLFMYLTTGTHCFKSGNDILPKKLASGLDVRYETEVKQIHCNDQGKVTSVETSEGTIEGSEVVSAVPSPELLPLYSKWNDDQGRFLREFTFGKLPLITFEGKLQDKVDYFSRVLDRRAGYKTNYLTVPNKRYESRISPSYLQAYTVHEEFAEDLIECPDDEIIDLITKDLHKIMPEMMKSVESAFVTRHQNQFPRYRVGTLEKLQKFMNSEGTPAGLYFAGDYTEGGLIEGAALSGYKAAQKII
jgi:oxygen-dependent protoporphyrinogen oxidase